MEIQIQMPTKNAVNNFTKWFEKEGFRSFIDSKYNKLKATNTDDYITCLSTVEDLTDYFNKFKGKYIELE